MGAAGEIEETGPTLGHPEKRRGVWSRQFAWGLPFLVSTPSLTRVRAELATKTMTLCLSVSVLDTHKHTQTIHPCLWGLSSLGRRVFLGRGRGCRAGGERGEGVSLGALERVGYRQQLVNWEQMRPCSFGSGLLGPQK